MNRKVVALNLILVALLAWGGTQLRKRWQEARQHEAEVLAKAPAPVSIVPPPSPAPVAPAPATEYIDVAQRTLFSADRNPNIEIPVEAPKPEPPVPPMPAYHGQMGFGEKPVILLSNANSPQKGYAVGDDVGEFKVLAFDQEHITLGWNGKEYEKELRTLAAKEEPRQARTPNVNAATPANGKGASKSVPTVARGPAAAKSANVAQIGGPANSAPAASKSNPVLGQPLGVNRACVPTDGSPAGTVLDGFKKVITSSLMGECYWEPTSK
jgi:hypothetical protein